MMIKKLIAALMVILLLAPLLFSCDIITGNDPALTSQTPAEGFAIYLTRDNIPVDKMEMQSHIEIAADPVITEDDIIDYNWETHEIKLTQAGWDKIQEIHPSAGGTSFVVCVNQGPIYWGAFWTPVSSYSWAGVTIMTPSLLSTKDTINIEIGYPYAINPADDPRDNPDVKAALETAGKLTGGEPGVTGIGFEIYLPKNGIPLEEMHNLDGVEISDTPVIGADDVLAYCWETHEVEITGAAFARIKQGPKDVAGTVFIACVDRQPVYWGAFWSMFSSSMPYCVTIDRPLTHYSDKYIVTIEEGYNANVLYGGDPRINPAVFDALEKTGKLTGPMVTYPPSTVTWEPEGLEIYLTKENISVTVNMAYAWPEREETPVIAKKDIVSYNDVTHELTLTPEAYRRLLELDIPVGGRSFIFTSNLQPIWWGFFWTPLSSISYDGYVICVPPLDELPENTVRIDYGYPVPYTPPKSDIRNNLSLEFLDEAGKLADHLVLFSYGKTAPVNTEGAAVYLTADNVSTWDMPRYRSIALSAEPFIGPGEILSYDWAKHEMTLTPEAYERISTLGGPNIGTSFVFCADGMPVYWGALWNGAQSLHFTGPVIGAFPYIEQENTVAIIFGMTGNMRPRGVDPRDDTRIIDALEKAGKLK